MGRNGFKPFGDGKSRCVGLDHESAQAFGARRLAGPAEDHIAIGNATIGDPGLLAVEDDMIIAVGLCGAGKGRHIRASFRLRQSESRNGFALGNGWQPFALLLFRPEKSNRPGSEALHGKGEIGKPILRGERFADETERSYIEFLR